MDRQQPWIFQRLDQLKISMPTQMMTEMVLTAILGNISIDADGDIAFVYTSDHIQYQG